MSHFTQGHALLIGIGTYQQMAQANIPITVADVRAVQAVLQDTNLCGYPAEQVKLLHDEATTRAGLLAALDHFAVTTNPASTVILYYAGHGAYGTDGNYYLTTHDSQQQGAKIVAGTGLSEAELIAKLRAIPAKRLLLILNACHAGEISPNLSLAAPISLDNSGPPAETIDAILSTGEGRIIMTACRPAQKSWIGQGQHTLFTQALVEGLRGQGYVANRNGYISAFGLYEHLYATVKARAAALGHPQEPELTVLRGVGPFPVAIYRGASVLGSFDTQEPLPADNAGRAVDPEHSWRLLKRYIRNTGIKVNTDGNNYVGHDEITYKTPVFNQRGQTVLGSQTNIAGDVNTSGGIFNSGVMSSGTTAAQLSLAAQLRALQAQLVQAGQQGIIDEDTAVDVNSALQKAINQADKANPDRQIIRRHLTTAKDLIQSIPAAKGLVAVINAINC